MTWKFVKNIKILNNTNKYIDIEQYIEDIEQY